MKWRTMLATAATLMCVATTTVRADHETWNWNMGKDRWAMNTGAEDLFRANEFTLDLSGAYSKGQSKFNDAFDRTMRHGTWGADAGVNYFFTRNFGIGGDVVWFDDRGSFVNNASGSLTFRWPIGPVAPYVFGGGGRNFDPTDEWTGHAGIGAELRLNPWTGIFADGRYVWADKSSDYTMLRVGLRLAFK